MQMLCKRGKHVCINDSRFEVKAGEDRHGSSLVNKRERHRTARVSELIRGEKKPQSTMMHDHANSIATEYDDA